MRPEQTPTDTRTALRQLAGKVAEQLVADAMMGLTANVTSGPGPVTITLHPIAEPKRLAPAPRTTRKYRRRKPRAAPAAPVAKVAKPAPAVDRREARTEPTEPTAPVAAETLRCPARACQKLGRVTRRADGSATCGFCGHTWRPRAKPTRAQTPAPIRATAVGCKGCAHPDRDHVDFTGQCIAKHCHCAAFQA